MQNKNRLLSSVHLIEDGFAGILLLGLAILILLEVGARLFFATGIPFSSDYIPHITLWIAFMGAMIATREKNHLSLTMGTNLVKGKLKDIIQATVTVICVAVSTIFFIASIVFLVLAFDSDKMIGMIPWKLVTSIIPAGFFIIMVRFIINSERKLIASSGILLGIVLGMKSILILIGAIGILKESDQAIAVFSQVFTPVMNIALIPLLIVLIVSSVLFGTPIFIFLGGLTILFLVNDGIVLNIIPDEAYNVFTNNKDITAIPLFAFAGFILSESKAGERFIKTFHALIGWLPGGLAIVTVVVCAFFTTFTGASGVTILALGALLSYVLVKDKYSPDFASGFITASGSIGLLFPPSLPVIMYGVAAMVSIKDLFVGGIFPGLLLVVTLMIMGVVHAKKHKVARIEFKLEELIEPMQVSLWELMLPVVVFVSFFSGLTTLVETGAITILYVLILEVFIYRDIKIADIPKIVTKCMPIIGGTLIILAIAKGLSFYIIYIGIPDLLANWCRINIQSPLVFLFLLNIGLLITGCFLDIFSAIFVVAPLIIPLGNLYGIHPIHLAIIFLANLQLGYITPPVGLNLYLAAYRFNKPLSKIYKDTVPFFFFLLITVLLITYVPWITTVFLPK
jgi:C4-dicarboxylate transporter DctM subunit